MEASPLEFPREHPVKALGKHTPDFRQQMLAAIHAEAGEAAVVSTEERLSRDGHYLSLTVTVRIETREHLDRVYRRLHDTGLLLFAL
jgi:hypothetical protein